ncbi:sensor domain-containing diguanylate cyclase [Aeromonas cavernicola]|uniref:diguanylate cyclase n=2 Tax=Aeromonas cavernicola TaxID=1006623 RepID=A0A2H9U5E5_9GAMM|nr:sensor domain-containing diguanylate cyclase [Aeromonas cavernicola]
MYSGKPKNTWSLIARMRQGLLLLFLPVLLLGAVYYLHMEQTLRQEQENNLISRNTQFFHTLVEPYIESLERQFRVIYQQIDYRDFSEKSIANSSRYLQEWQAYHKVMEFDYIYAATEQRQILIYPAWQANDKFDPRTRPWYLLAASHPGLVVWTNPYYDYALHTLAISLARVIEDPAGKRVGVLSIDTQLTPLANWLNHTHQQAEHGRQDYQMLITQDGLVLAHPDRQRLFQPLTHPSWLARMQGPQGFFIDEKSNMMVAYHQVSEQRWILLSVIPTASLQQIIERVSLNVELMIGVACLLYLLLAVIWSRYFQRMLAEIIGLIRASRAGELSHPNRRMLELSNLYDEIAAASHDFAQIRQQANQDKLTGLYNRRFFDECLQQQISAGNPIGLAMFDLDDFKQINDNYGHQSGDIVLKRVSKLGLTLFHEWGWFCRYGGEELVLIFHHDAQSTDMLTSLLEAFRHGVEQLEWREPNLRITVSGGVALGSEHLNARVLVEQADSAVYQAKREGKNRIIFPSHSGTLQD